MSDALEITVLGAGVVGLTTAVRLRESGHRVRVVADRGGVESTSGAAGAIWFPYLAEPAERVAVWGRTAYRWLAALRRESPEAGVAGLTPLYLPVDGGERPRWADAVPSEAGLRYLARRDLPEAARRLAERSPRPPAGAWVFEAPVVDPPSHLAWLARGLELEIDPGRPVRDLDELPGDRVVCCAGPRAGRLAADPELRPTLGQVIEAPAAGPPADFAWADERDPERVVYAFARAGGMVLGGCSLRRPQWRRERPWEAPGRPAPDPEVTAAIAERWRRLGVEPGPQASARAGWRPVRSTVRVERAGRVVYNYGQGGAGFTLARGCAEEVATLVAGE